MLWSKRRNTTFQGKFWEINGIEKEGKNRMVGDTRYGTGGNRNNSVYFWDGLQESERRVTARSIDVDIL